ncbi:MAG: hypothetical protein U1F26_16255 [Lysobacterales bacterium]
MRQQDLDRARNPDLRASLAAMRRAAQAARQLAVQTNTAIIVVEDGKPVRIAADQLREAANTDRVVAPHSRGARR